MFKLAREAGGRRAIARTFVVHETIDFRIRSGVRCGFSIFSPYQVILKSNRRC
jgi:hypothetical protein